MKRHQFGGRTANASHVPLALTSIKMENASHLLQHAEKAKLSQKKILACAQQDIFGIKNKIDAELSRLCNVATIRNFKEIP